MKNVTLLRHFLFMEMNRANIVGQYKLETMAAAVECEGIEQRQDVCICGTVVITCRVTS